MFSWTIGLVVLNPESLYYGGYFRASMTFPKNYPYSPPGMSVCLFFFFFFFFFFFLFWGGY